MTTQEQTGPDTADGMMAEVERLYDAGLYRQALDAGEAAWGPVRLWPGTERRLLASRVISQLGLDRTAAAMVFDCWRRGARDADLAYAYVRMLFNVRGPYRARMALREWEGKVTRTPEQQARWLGLAGVIHGAFRDWEQAHACIDQAMALSADPDDFLFERAWLLESQDRYAEAFETLSRVPYSTPNRERFLIHAKARLQKITGGADLLLDELQAAFARFESVDLGMFLHQSLTEADRLDEADACLSRLLTLVPVGDRLVADGVAVLRGNLHYRRDDLEATREAWQPVRGHFFRRVCENLARATPETPRRELDVPFIRQHHMTCAPATLTAIWRYHGVALDHLTLAEAICYDGTSDLSERRWVESQGWTAREFELNLDDIRTLIDAGCPVGLATVEPGSAHMQAIIGYDLRKGIYLIRDPFFPSIQEMLIEGAQDVYAASGPRCMVCVPPERAAWLAALPLRAAPLYDHYFRLQDALSRHRRDEAVAERDALRAEAPGHRLTCWAERSLSGYDSDPAGILAATETLLAQFPQDLNLLVGRARLLGDLGKREEQEAFLEDCLKRGFRHPLLVQALAELLAQDNRRAAEVRELVDSVLRQQPLNPAAWWTLAGLHWDSQEHAQAFEYYRLCLCIADKVEGYATSYFKAARFLRRTDEALETLRRRIDWLGALSANPYITYARALDMLDRNTESLAVLDQALARHPEDGWLVAEAFDLHIYAGHQAEAEALLVSHGHLLSAALRLHKQAALARYRVDREAELGCWRELLVMQPRNEQAISQVARLLVDGGRLDEALALLDSHLAENPHNLWLQREKLKYVRLLPVEARRPAIEQALALHPEDVAIVMAAARQARAEGQGEDALALMRQAAGMDPDEAWIWLELGDVCLDLARVEEAREAYRRAIAMAVDSDGAFARLLATYTTFEDKRHALEFIHAELMRQVSFGNGILEFQLLARRYLPDAQVEEFLEAAVRQRPDLWQSWVGAARFHRETNRLDRALALLDDAANRFPLIPRVWLERAEIHRLEENLSLAESDLRTAIAISPQFANAITLLADILEMGGNRVEALSVLRRAMRLSPGHAPYAGYCADILWRSGKREEAWKTLAAVLELSPDYGWGWGQLKEWSVALGCLPEAFRLVSAMTVRYPDSVELWQRRAEMTDNPGLRRESLERALALAPHRTDTLLDLCNLLLDQDQPREVRALLDRSYPDAADRPSEIRTYEAWLIHRTGRLNEAIAALEAVTVDDPGHYNAWRLLTLWRHQAGDGAGCCRSARQCVALHPQQAGVLVMAAEYLLAHEAEAGPDRAAVRAEVREWMERAVAIDHTNMYNALTLADLYLDDGLLQPCAELFARGTLESRDPYLQARELRLHLLRGNRDRALSLWRQFLRQARDNEWLLLQPYAWFVDRQLRDPADEAIRAETAEAEPNPLAARVWIQSLLAAKPDGQRLLAELNRVRHKTAFWTEAVHFLLTRQQPEGGTLSPLLNLTHDDLETNPRTWEALVSYRIGQEDWIQLRRLGRRAQALPDAAARSVYFCQVGVRASSDWPEARRLRELALERPRDDSLDNLRFWQQFDGWLADHHGLAREVLANLDLRELTRVERLLLQWLQGLAEMPDRIGQAEVMRSAALWTQACRDWPGVYSNPIIDQSCRHVRRALRRRVGGNPLQRLFTHVRLMLAFRPPREAAA